MKSRRTPPIEPAARNPSAFATARGTVQAAVAGVQGVVGIVESMHQRILGVAPPIGGWREAPTRGITGFVYRSIRGTTGLVGAALDTALASAQAALPDTGDGHTSPAQELVISALNGVVGDHLHETANPLAISLQLRGPADGPGTAASPAPGHLLVVVHGLCMTDAQWTRHGHNHAQLLAAALGCRIVYVRYNSGRHVSDNGSELADALQALAGDSAVPVERITFLAHSMGGLVTRAAIHAAIARGLPWAQCVRDVVFLGTPHHGAPLERGGNWVHTVLGASPYLQPFGRLAGLRSAGITDLRHGNLLASDWRSGRFAHRDARSPMALPAGVICFAVAGSIGPQAVGDGLVTVESALGRHRQRTRDLRLPNARRFVAEGVGHLDLLSSPEVGRQLLRWLAKPG
jgi:hypothetical protein